MKPSIPTGSKGQWKETARQTAVSLAFAISGAVAATVIGLPAPVLVGATFATTAAALMKLNPVLPNWLSNLGFAVIGGTLGTGVSPSFFSDIAHYPVSIALLTISVGLTILVSGYALNRLYGYDRNTAVLATSPGALSYTLAFAVSGYGDPRAIMVLQSIRLLLITLLLPQMLALIGGDDTGRAHAVSVLSLQVSFLVIALSLLAGKALQRLRAPAAWLLGGLVVSGAAHGFGLISGSFADPITFAGFTIAGAVIGSRFAGITREETRHLAVAGIAATFLSILVSAIMGTVTSMATGLPFAEVWIAFAPGGVEGMSAMALALNYDPVFVATHHIYRIALLIACIPFLLKRN